MLWNLCRGEPSIHAMTKTIELAPGLTPVRTAAIPIINIAPLLAGDMSPAAAIGSACREVGFFYITNHGIPNSVIDEVYKQAKRFFDLPVAEKEKYAIDRSTCHRGWFRLGEENLDPARQTQTGDFKEGFKIGRDLPLSHERVKAGLPLHGPDIWPDLPGWQPVMQDYYDRMVALGTLLLRAFAVALALPPTYFDAWLDVPMTTLGPLHYPPQTGLITPARLGAGAHTDYGCLTLLHQDSAGGLQVQAQDGRWLEAPPVPGSFVVNIGDMMERWTNGVFRSTLHRVINISGRDRYALPFFFDPDFYAPVSCLPTCLPAGEQPKYPPTTAGQHLLDMINTAFKYRSDA